jgi:large subunit ribosomal protein L13
MKTIDAQNKSLGRIASAAAKMLMGKDEPDYTPHIPCGQKVQIINASKIKFDAKKLKNTKHAHYTEYHSGLKEITLEKEIERKGYSEVVKKAVSGMIPTNTLKKGRLQNLEILD